MRLLLLKNHLSSGFMPLAVNEVISALSFLPER
jgi:hypothetical protein